eukprot:g24873.t1
MELNPSEMLHFGRSNVMEKYTVNGRTLKTIDVQRDLEVQVHRPLKVAMQVGRVVKKAHSMLALVGREIEYKSQDVMLQLYKTL